MLIKKSADIRYSQITPKSVYLNRRRFLAGVPAAFMAARELVLPAARAQAATKLPDLVKSPLSTLDEKPNSFKDVSTYNNYYEFGTGKEQPVVLAQKLKSEPWTGSGGREGAQNRKIFVHW